MAGTPTAKTVNSCGSHRDRMKGLIKSKLDESDNYNLIKSFILTPDIWQNSH